jgi:hypothetical protein
MNGREVSSFVQMFRYLEDSSSKAPFAFVQTGQDENGVWFYIVEMTIYGIKPVVRISQLDTKKDTRLLGFPSLGFVVARNLASKQAFRKL